jgi:acyl carrier protein
VDDVLKILRELRPDVDFDSEQSLIDGGVLDSFDIVSLVGEINDAFDVTVPPQELIPENFNSALTIWKLIERLQDADM